MNSDGARPAQAGKYRFVQVLLVVSGLAFIAVGAFLLTMGGGDVEGQMTVLAVALIIVGFGDLFLAFFIFRRDMGGGNSGGGGT